MKKEKIVFIIGVITIIIASTISVYAANYLYNSSEVSYDNTTSKITSDNVQGAIDELYATATDYTELKSYFVGNPTSRFNKYSGGDGLEVGYTSTTGNTYIDLYYNEKLKSSFYYDASKDQTVLTSRDSTILNLIGSPVQINGTSVSDLIKFKSVSASISRSYSSYVSITAPSYSGYKFVTWYHVASTGWVGSLYAETPGNTTTNVWNASYGQSGTGSIICYALYIKN